MVSTHMVDLSATNHIMNLGEFTASHVSDPCRPRFQLRSIGKTHERKGHRFHPNGCRNMNRIQ